MRSTARTRLLSLLVLVMSTAPIQHAIASGAPLDTSSSPTALATFQSQSSASNAILAALPPGGTFTDDNGNTFEGLIEAIAAAGITKGCNPPTNNRFCPNDPVTRGEMAVFITRAKPFSAASDYFVDVAGRFYADAANRLSEAGVTLGCNPPSNNRYCGERPITRGEMAALLVRTFELTDNGGGDLFDDDDRSQYEEAIDRLATKGITKGCNPPANDRFCPDDYVTRGQMAAFIARALGLKPIVPPPAGQIVTGTLELKGKVSLQQDLIIDGGKLIARNGAEVNGNGHQIAFMNGGVAQWDGAIFRNLSRVMFHHCAGVSTIRNTEVIDTGVTEELGFYPLHWHLNGECTRGTLVENVTVKGGRNHAFVPHGSHGITFRNISAYNTTGTAFWWDPPDHSEHTTNNSNDITIDGALIDGVKPPGNESGFRLAGFLLGAGEGNEIRNATVRNVHGSKSCAAYHWPEESNHNRGGTTWVFENNQGSSDCHGIFVWQNDGGTHVVKNFKGGGISQGAYENDYDYINPQVPYFEVHSVGVTVDGGSVGRVIAESAGPFNGTVTFRNTKVTGFEVWNESSYDVSITYKFINTGLTCGMIDYHDVHPGTRIEINNAPPCPLPSG